MRQFDQTHQDNLALMRERYIVRTGFTSVRSDNVRKPVGYDPEKLKRLTLAKTKPATVKNSPSRIYIGERGGRYYKRTRVDGTTYREYTW